MRPTCGSHVTAVFSVSSRTMTASAMAFWRVDSLVTQRVTRFCRQLYFIPTTTSVLVLEPTLTTSPGASRKYATQRDSSTSKSAAMLPSFDTRCCLVWLRGQSSRTSCGEYASFRSFRPKWRGTVESATGSTYCAAAACVCGGGDTLPCSGSEFLVGPQTPNLGAVGSSGTGSDVCSMSRPLPMKRGSPSWPPTTWDS